MGSVTIGGIILAVIGLATAALKFWPAPKTATTVSTDEKLGQEENEIEHVKQDQTDRATLDAIKPVSGDDSVSRMRDGTA